MSSTVARQSLALIRRYGIYLASYPISTFLRVVIWPAIFIGPLIYLIIRLVGDDNKGHLASFPFSIITPIVIIFVTFFHVAHFTNRLVAERSTGVKSLMLSMGLKRTSYYMANSICMLATILPIAVILCGSSFGYVLRDKQTPVLITILASVLFSIHWTANVFAFVSLVTSTKLANLMYGLAVIQIPLCQFVIELVPKFMEPLQPVFLFFASISPYESISILLSSYELCKDSDTTHYIKDEVSQPTYVTLVAMTLWSIMAFAFSRWAEEVCPWQKDSAVKSPLFCFNSSNNYGMRYQFSDFDEDITRNSRYFEQTMANQEVGIRIHRLTKEFKTKPAVNNISFNIYKGETTLLLGHNGAGKTTLMEMILGKLEPTEGGVFLIDSNRQMSQSRHNVGVCPQTSILDENLTVKQHLELFADLKSSYSSDRERADHIRATIADTSLTSEMRKLPNELSGGMKRKLSLAMAFVGDSSILVLDEPSSGLDPDSRMFVWNSIRKYRGTRTVLLSTQHMEEADYLGDRIAIMKEGQIICCGSSTFLNKIYGSGYKLRIECLASKKDQVLSFVRKYFASAEPSENIQMVTPVSSRTEIDPVEDFVIELNDDRSKKAELGLILMLEEIECDSASLHIKSHSLKSSSMEDVLLNTSKITLDSQEALSLQMNSTSSLIDSLAMPTIWLRPSSFAAQWTFFCALMIKHFHINRRNWGSLLFYRVLLPIYVMYMLVRKLGVAEVRYLPKSSLIPLLTLNYIYNPVLERTTKFKTMQLTSDANFVVYWLAHALSDVATSLVPAIALDLFLAFSFDGQFPESKILVLTIVTIAMMLVSLSAALLAYILSFIITDLKTCTDYFIRVTAAGYLILQMIRLVEVIFSYPLILTNSILSTIFIAFCPIDSFQYIIHGLEAECYITKVAELCIKTDTFSPIIYGFIMLIIQILVYGSVLYVIEKFNIDLAWYFRWNTICFCKQVPFTKSEQEIDDDVMRENAKAASLMTKAIQSETYSMVVSDLSKSYERGTRAVDQLSFTVNRRECFGLLGVNGAGKSTTFAMLVDELKPDSGKIWVNGYFNTDDATKYRHSIGYDPQSNPETPLSSTEALWLIARLRQVPEQSISRMVDTIMELLSMSEHADKPASILSGGTKRKLTLGMSLIGRPSLLALDEPTAGVDPIARRSIWQLLRSLRAQDGASIVISSHAMEECEAICDRISIMARGRLRCIGSFLNLRAKFTQGCSVRIQFSSQTKQVTEEETGKLIRVVSERLQNELGDSVKLTDTNANSATYNISDNSVRRSKIFKSLADLGQEFPQVSYRVNDSSLEDIFIALAREQVEIEERQ